MKKVLNTSKLALEIEKNVRECRCCVGYDIKRHMSRWAYLLEWNESIIGMRA